MILLKIKKGFVSNKYCLSGLYFFDKTSSANKFPGGAFTHAQSETLGTQDKSVIIEKPTINVEITQTNY